MENTENCLREAMSLASESYSVATYEKNFVSREGVLLLASEETEFVALNS